MQNRTKASRMNARRPEQLMQIHRATGQPLDELAVRAIVDAGITTWDDWEDRGEGLYWHSPTFPESEE